MLSRAEGDRDEEGRGWKEEEIKGSGPHMLACGEGKKLKIATGFEK